MGAAASCARRLRVLREVLGGAPELIFESPEVPLEPLGVILGRPESIRSSGFGFQGLFGIQNCQPSSFWQQRKSFCAHGDGSELQSLQLLKRFNMSTFFGQATRVPSRPRKVSLLGLRFRGRRPWAQPNRIRRPRRGAAWGSRGRSRL